MESPEENTELAYKIGLSRIALIVDRVHRRTQTHRAFAKFFQAGTNDDDRKARLTYFWWVALGGNKLCDHDLEPIPAEFRAQNRADLLRDWLALFHQAALPLIGEDLTHAWMDKAQELGTW